MNLALAKVLVEDWLAGRPLTVRSPQWPAVRKRHLKLFPCCAVCLTKKALEVHHLYPVGWPGGRDMELLESNLLTLCRPHHFLYGHLEDWSSVNWDCVKDVAAWGLKLADRPLPPKEG